VHPGHNLTTTNGTIACTNATQARAERQPAISVDSHAQADGDTQTFGNSQHSRSQSDDVPSIAGCANKATTMDYADDFQPGNLLDGFIYFDDDAPFNFINDFDIDFDQFMENLAEYDEMGRIDIAQWPVKNQRLVRRSLPFVLHHR
jgi:hypothetical protein